ncbi:MAG: DoxX family membrane protein [Bacteroidia bacterium]|nr:DoxX family membrane protein [Bacteroidia bacterium]NNM23267.1 DoxX family membrane protein [Flavobacteriaceae bacterium]
MKSAFSKILRLILAIGLLLFGLNKFFSFFPMFEMPPAAANFMESLESTGYVFYVVAVLELIIGFLLLINKWVPFALILLAPISFNILLFHLFLDISDVWVAIVIVVLNTILIYKYWRSYRPLFQSY